MKAVSCHRITLDEPQVAAIPEPPCPACKHGHVDFTLIVDENDPRDDWILWYCKDGCKQQFLTRLTGA